MALLNAWQTEKVKKKQEVFEVLADGVCWRRQEDLAALIKIGGRRSWREKVWANRAKGK